MKLIMRTVIILSLGAVSLFTAHTYAGGLYIAPSAVNLDTDAADFKLVNITAGYDFNEYVGIRGSWMLSAKSEKLGDVTIDLDKMYGGDLVFSLPGESFSPYAFVGQTFVKVKASYHGFSATAKDDFTTYGLGLNYSFNPTAGAFLEYKEIDGADSISAGLKIEF